MATKKKNPPIESVCRHPKPAPKYEENASRCDNCGNIDHDLDIGDIDDLLDRIEPGGTVPSGECTKCKCLSYPIRSVMSDVTLENMLESYSVGYVDDDHNKANGGRLSGIIGWHWVCNDDGVFAYFGKESDAFRFRLAEINRRLNG